MTVIALFAFDNYTEWVRADRIESVTDSMMVGDHGMVTLTSGRSIPLGVQHGQVERIVTQWQEAIRG